MSLILDLPTLHVRAMIFGLCFNYLVRVSDAACACSVYRCSTAVKKNEDVTARGGHACVPCTTGVARSVSFDDRVVGPIMGEPGDDVVRPVGRAIIDDHDIARQVAEARSRS